MSTHAAGGAYVALLADRHARRL